MHSKNIKRIIQKELKQNYPNWNRLNRKTKKEISRQVLAVITSYSIHYTKLYEEVMPVRSLRLADGTELEFPAGGGALTQRAKAYYSEYVDAYVAANAQYSLY